MNIDEVPGDARIWRYMDLPRFIDLLRTSSLYLASLPTMEDPWEGATAPMSDRAPSVAHLMGIFGGTVEMVHNFIDAQEQANEQSRRGIYINCWHRSEVESAAMWKLYDPSGRGIAVSTTVDGLSAAIRDEGN